MEENTIAFIIWCIGGMFFICLAIYIWFSRKAIFFWGRSKIFEVTNIRKYNHAISKLYGIYGIVFILLGLPLLAGADLEWIFFASAGVVIESIVLMAVITLVIEKKYKK